jgi:hypothetical protein
MIAPRVTILIPGSAAKSKPVIRAAKKRRMAMGSVKRLTIPIHKFSIKAPSFSRRGRFVLQKSGNHYTLVKKIFKT